MLRSLPLVLAALWSIPAPPAPGQPAPAPTAARPTLPTVPVEGPSGPGIDPAALRAAVPAGGKVAIEAFPLQAGLHATLILERFSITGPQTRFVLGRAGAPDDPFLFDPASVVLLRGHAEGYPHSHVYLAVSDWATNGYIDLGPGHGSFAVASRPGAPGGRSEQLVSVFDTPPSGGLPPGVQACRYEALPDAPPAGAPRGRPRRGLKQIELAIETDHEYYQLFHSADAAAAYIVTLYGAISDIYIRDVDVRFDLTYVRLWDSPDDLFNQADPLNAFAFYWNSTMNHVHRDVAQFFSGRRDLRAGGVAYVSALCTGSAYSWAGYALGYFANPDQPHWSLRDIEVAAHELGHNCGTLHTHDYGIDTCGSSITPPRRGTLMSYCAQTVSGGTANMDMRFCTHTQGWMDQHIRSVPCLADDCNGNNIDDAVDISSGTSPDANANGVPDECEDCNANGILDPQEIASGIAADLNANGLPDECEPDCNANGIPDDLDIQSGASRDVHMNGVPDECEPDLDLDGVSDYNEIVADMPLDIDRNIRLDQLQDCDGDGLSDLDELNGSHHLWVATRIPGEPAREFYPSTGVLTRISSQTINQGYDLLITPDRRILVSSHADDRIIELDHTGAFVRDLVPPGGSGLDGPAGLALTPEGALLVASRNTHAVLEFDAATGAFVRAAVAPGEGGLLRPFGLALTPAGALLVTSDDNRVLEFARPGGQLLRVLVPAAGNGNLSGPRGMALKPDGNLLVASYTNASLLEYNGSTGAFIRKFNRSGDGDVLTLDEPWGVRIGPDGGVYATTSHAHRSGGGTQPLHVTTTRVFHYDAATGNYIRSFVVGHDTGLLLPTGLAFMPDDGSDCNRNQRPDACDIASGASADRNGNGTPDECECPADCDGDGDVTLADFICFRNLYTQGDAAADCDRNGVVTLQDFICFRDQHVTGCR